MAWYTRPDGSHYWREHGSIAATEDGAAIPPEDDTPTNAAAEDDAAAPAEETAAPGTFAEFLQRNGVEVDNADVDGLVKQWLTERLFGADDT